MISFLAYESEIVFCSYQRPFLVVGIAFVGGDENPVAHVRVFEAVLSCLELYVIPDGVSAGSAELRHCALALNHNSGNHKGYR